MENANVKPVAPSVPTEPCRDSAFTTNVAELRTIRLSLVTALIAIEAMIEMAEARS